MEKDWVPLYRSSSPTELEIIRSMLDSHEIAAVVLNQRDSSYLAFGEATLLVRNVDYVRARGLLDKHMSDES